MRDAVPAVFHLSYFLPIQRNYHPKVYSNLQSYSGEYRALQGEFGNHAAILQYLLDRDGLIHGNKFDDLKDKYKIMCKKKARDHYLAISFLMGGTRSKYGQLVADLQNLYIMGVDQYPQNIEEAYDMILSYSPVVVSVNPGKKEIKDLYTTGISFHQAPADSHGIEPSNKIVPGISGKTSKNILCYACNTLGYYANNCPGSNKDTKNEDKHTDEKGFSFMQYNLNLMQMNGKQLNPKWVLLDTQSSCDIFNNTDLLHDIKTESETCLNFHSNGDGFINSNMTGVVCGYGKVWYHNNSLSKITSFLNVRKKFRIEINTGPNDQVPSINVIKNNGKVMKFKEIACGLYVYDASNDIKNKDTLNKSCHYSFVSTI